MKNQKRNAYTPENFGIIVADILNELRESQGLTTNDIVKRIEISSGTIYDIFSGKSQNPSFYNVFLIVTGGMELKFKKFSDHLDKESSRLNIN